MSTFHSPENLESQRPEHARMQRKLEAILTNPVLREAVKEDSVTTFENLGLTNAEANELFAFIEKQLTENPSVPLTKIEEVIFQKFADKMVGDKTLVQKLDEALADRAKLILSQIRPYLDREKPVFDFGAGDGDVSYNLRRVGFTIAAATDVIDYRKAPPAGQKELPFTTYNGESLAQFSDKQFAQSIMTNVAHHAGETAVEGEQTKGNEAMLRELCRVTADRIVVLETIPDPALIQKDGLKTAHERTRWNDYLYNRLFHAYVGDGKRTDIPVPGRYETDQGWLKRFKDLGWKPKHVIPLEYDQPSICDYHIQYVFERDPNATVVSTETHQVRKDTGEILTINSPATPR